jgi:hypothetical protein
VDDVQVDDHRSHSISKAGGELNVSTPLTPDPGHLLCLYFMGCAKQVRDLHYDLSVCSSNDTEASGKP